MRCWFVVRGLSDEASFRLHAFLRRLKTAPGRVPHSPHTAALLRLETDTEHYLAFT